MSGAHVFTLNAFAPVSPSLFKTWICILGIMDTLPRSEFWKLLICQVSPTQALL